MKKGTTLIELILYVGLLSTILVVLYEFFAVATNQKISESALAELSLNAEYILTDVTRSVSNASIITRPAYGQEDISLSLDTGEVAYAVDDDGIVQKTEGGVTLPISNKAVVVDALIFKHLGPSSQYATVLVQLDLHGRQSVDGRVYSDSYQTAMTIR